MLLYLLQSGLLINFHVNEILELIDQIRMLPVKIRKRCLYLLSSNLLVVDLCQDFFLFLGMAVLEVLQFEKEICLLLLMMILEHLCLAHCGGKLLA
jgi:hypothetical protein